MPSFDIGSIVLVGITLFAAFVNGALGYGFSSLTVPVALVFYTNRILNPALVLIEVLINLYVLFINRASVPAVWNRVYPILIGLLPGIAVGSYLLASLHPSWIKFVTYTVLLPLILVQAAGIRRPIRSERLIGLPFGAGLGFLYSVTTVSGPPLAILFNNQGLVMFAVESQSIFMMIIPGVLVGIPLGAYLIRRLDAETFRRICMSFDAWVVGFGLSRVLIDLKLMESPWAYSVMVLAIVIDSYLLYVFFTKWRSAARRSEGVNGDGERGGKTPTTPADGKLGTMPVRDP
ncbi:MAG: sulfite exporter TauE/SafE family protein [Nitrospirae bacterium]|nr:MAG: sulfite exporter TauE/SafE family protein [Nitrospirota bacterium]